MNQAVISPVEEQEENQYEGFQITNDNMAEWAVQKIREAQSDTAKWRAHFEAQLSGIQKHNDDTVAAMTMFLARYFGTVPHQATKTQEKYELPGATLVLKQREPEYKRDDEALLKYLDKNKRADLIRIKREPAWDAIKKGATVQGETLVDTETGEVISGVRVVARPDTFDVKIKE